MRRGYSKSKFLPLRRVDVREERAVPIPPPRIVFSFNDLDVSQIPPGFSYADLQRAGQLDSVLERIGQVCERSVEQACREELLCIYGDFPKESGFKCPRKYEDDNLRWAVIRNISGQKGRVAGYIVDNIFHVVFLDMNHKFWITKKKHT